MWSLGGSLPLHLSQRCPLHHQWASRLLEETLTEELSGEQEPEGWIARPITRDAAREYHFHDALDTLLCQAFDRHTWSIEYRCVVYQHRRGLYPD
jgi:hypothetical protein